MYNTTKFLVQIALAIDRLVFSEERSAHANKLSWSLLHCLHQLEPFGVDPKAVTHTPAMVEHGQDTTSEESTD